MVNRSSYAYKRYRYYISDIFLAFLSLIAVYLASVGISHGRFLAGFTEQPFYYFFLVIFSIVIYSGRIGKRRMCPVVISDSGIEGFFHVVGKGLLVKGGVRFCPWNEICDVVFFGNTVSETYAMGGRSGVKLVAKSDEMIIWSNIVNYEGLCKEILERSGREPVAAV